MTQTTGRRAEQTLTLETQDNWAILDQDLEGSIRSTDFSFIEGSKANDRRQLENIWALGEGEQMMDLDFNYKENTKQLGMTIKRRADDEL